jgi:transposase-like protein
METVHITRRTDGKIRATEEEKRKLLDLLNSGAPIAEVARAHNLTVQTLVKWRRADVKTALRFEGANPPDTAQSHSEMKAEIRRLVEENQKLRRALGNVAYDRDILQEAYNIASKKKWI